MDYEITKIDENTWILGEGFVRFFLLAGKERALLIDTGMNVGKAKEAAEALVQVPVQLINTHADPDHTGGNKAFNQVMMHEDEKQNYHVLVEQKIISVTDGQIIELGDRPVQIVWIPGHTPGSIGILDINKRYFFSGDTVQQNSEIFMFGPMRNLERFAQSLEKLNGMTNKFDLIFPCHGAVPIKPEIIPQMIEGTKKVLAGEISKTPKQMMFGANVNACDIGCDVLLVE